MRMRRVKERVRKSAMNYFEMFDREVQGQLEAKQVLAVALFRHSRLSSEEYKKALCEWAVVPLCENRNCLNRGF